MIRHKVIFDMGHYLNTKREINTNKNMTQRLNKINKQHNGIGSRPKLEPCHKWARGPIKNKIEHSNPDRMGHLQHVIIKIQKSLDLHVTFWHYDSPNIIILCLYDIP